VTDISLVAVVDTVVVSHVVAAALIVVDVVFVDDRPPLLCLSQVIVASMKES